MAEFVALGIEGMKSQTSVAKYRKAWAKAIADGVATDVKPGDLIDLPDVYASRTRPGPVPSQFVVKNRSNTETCCILGDATRYVLSCGYALRFHSNSGFFEWQPYLNPQVPALHIYISSHDPCPSGRGFSHL